ncbi:MAG: sigma 54-interacting transcriptional regulator [Polyangiaceae bacterium]|nr:sigma 54-interacting transcriptional regulator [Polyangiaceae bacterium]
MPSEKKPSDTEVLPRTRVLRFRRVRVKVIEGPDRGVEHVSEAPEIGIGTARGNDLVLTDRAVSRHHCVLASGEHGWSLRDLGTTNGTRLGGFRVETAYLEPGATIRIGTTTLCFEDMDDEVREPLSDAERYGRILGQSPAMRRIFAVLPKLAASESTVLLEGETGTGKGLMAEAIHQQSGRAGGPFIVLDCSAIPPTLIEAELFGHTRGAFTGAHAARPGAFEAAACGTLFLDEIGELPIDMQPKLLRALEERAIRRIGSVETVRLDVRVIAATNRDLRQEVNRGRFRSDLFYRLNVVRIRIPPLRERREDIAMLTAHFYEQFARGGAAPSAETLASFVDQDWPGNVRELRSAVERAVLMDDPDVWRELASPPPEAAPAPLSEPVFDPAIAFRVAKERATAQWERAYVEALVRSTGGNLSQAARVARTDRNYLRELLRKHGVSVKDDERVVDALNEVP